MNYKQFLAENNSTTDDAGYIVDETNQEILSHIWQEVFHLLDKIPSEIANIDAGAIASQVQHQVECQMLRRYVDSFDAGTR